MNRLQFQQVESLFEAAVGYDAPARQMFLDRIAREHSREIRDMVERLLDADRSQTRWSDFGSSLSPSSDHPLSTLGPSSPIGASGHSADPEPAAAGTVLDRFRLIHRLGFGGHGEVYLADQLQPVQRQVALKMVRFDAGGGAMRDRIIERFRAEQQALAVMSHPGIASVYEAGLADQGRLFFAMEYVQGEPIDAYSDQRRLPIRERLQLFLKVCHAVQHAHQKGLIHRDLKPSNILVTQRDGAATPVLIDFGIAVATATPDLDSRSAIATSAPASAPHAAGTPAYMSPEQASASADIDTRTDIYALGIVLYEMLTGRTPVDVLAPPGSSLAEIRRSIVEGVAPSPAALLDRDETLAIDSATKRDCTLKLLRRQVRGDLNVIVMHAIARDRAHRYQTVEALAKDVEHHLRHQPISVGSTNTAARVRKFIRRHTLAVSAAAGIALVLVIGVVGVTLAMLRADHAARETKAVNDFLTNLLTSSRPLEKGSSVSFAEVLAGGSELAGDEFAAYPQQEGEVRYLIGHTYFTLGMYREARGELDHAVALLRTSLGMRDVRTLHAASLLAMTLQAQNRRDESQTLIEEVLLNTEGQPMPLRERNLAAQRLLYVLQSDRGDYEVAKANLRALIPQIDAELGPTHVEAYNARLGLMQVLRRISNQNVSSPRTGTPFEEEIALLRETVDLQKQRFGDKDAMPLLSSQLKLAQLLIDQHRHAEAEEIVVPLVPRISRSYGTKHWMYGEATIALASIKYAKGDHAGAADDYLESLQCWRSLHPPEHPISISVTRDGLPYLDAAGRVEDGLRESKQYLDMTTRVLGPDDIITLEAKSWVARFTSLAGRLDEADAMFAELQSEKYAEMLRTEANGAYTMLFHAGHLARRGKFEEAEAELLKLCERQEDVSNGVNIAHADDIARMFIEVYAVWNKPEKVKEYQAIVESIWKRSR